MVLIQSGEIEIPRKLSLYLWN